MTVQMYFQKMEIDTDYVEENELVPPLDGSLLDVSYEEIIEAVPCNKFTCKVCLKMYKTKCTLRHHAKTHVNDAHFCTSCSRIFKSEELLMTHKREKHSPSELCMRCGKTCTSKSILN